MSALVALSLAALLAALFERRRRLDGGPSIEMVVVAGATWLVMVGLVATVLAVVGRFGEGWMVTATGLTALAAWPWGHPPPPRRARSWRRFIPAALIVLAGLGLRWPVADYPLAGRDQGTYTLRAQHTLREGRLDAVDEVLARAGAADTSHPGPADILGLYHHDRTPWRQGLYEAAYRPGFYLADVERGAIRAQFFHLHPMVMATAGLVAGPRYVAAVMPLYAALAILALWAAARRLWPTGPWSWLAAALWVCAPLAIWVQRTALSEGPASMLVLVTLVAVLRARDGDPRALGHAALLLGALAWVRGNGWLIAPLILATQWLVPQADRHARRASRVYAAIIAGAIVVHATTTFPYLHDELLRQLPLAGITPTPTVLIAVMVAGLLAWRVLDELPFLRRREARWLPVIHRHAPRVLVAVSLAGVVAFVIQRPEVAARPFSRLDPVWSMLGPMALGLASIGLASVVRRWRPEPTAAHAWQLGLAAMVAATVLLYAQRNLPQLSLYYYGRYLVPELLPALLLLAVEGLRSIDAGLRGSSPSVRRRRLASVAGLAGACGLVWSVAGVLVVHPVTRLAEFEGADRVVDDLAAHLPDDAVVIAGGEGWHSGHTYNQVGGALAFRHGIAVLPYRDKEAAYATLHELLVAQPQRHGLQPRPVFLLLNEATKHHTRVEDDGTKTRVAGLDDLLPPPFVARRVDLVEMFVDRLSPSPQGPPTRVTRDGLRMALLHVEVEPHRWAEIERWRLRTMQGRWVADGPPGLTASGEVPVEGSPCLGSRPLELQLPETGAAGHTAVSLVVVAVPGTAATNPRWRLEVDGLPVGLDPPGRAPRHRDTLGPFTFASRPRRVTIVGAPEGIAEARCPHGGVIEVRLLGTDSSALAHAPTTATTFAPARSLGHPVDAVAWVPARGLSRRRPGLRPAPKLEGPSIVVTPEAAVDFPVAMLPAAGRDPVDVVVTLTAMTLHPDARLVLSVGGEVLTEIDPPDARRGSWQSPPVRWTPTGAAAAFGVTLRNAATGDRVLLRDIGLFSRAPPIAGHLSLQ